MSNKHLFSGLMFAYEIVPDFRREKEMHWAKEFR